MKFLMALRYLNILIEILTKAELAAAGEPVDFVVKFDVKNKRIKLTGELDIDDKP